MREKPDVVRESSSEASEKEVQQKRIDLSVPQVAGSAVAAVLAAKLASSFGVYGTIAGAGLVSVIATCGGSLFQHFFKRTGEQLRTGRTPVRVAMGAAPQAPSAPGEFSEGAVYRARVRGWKRWAPAAAVVFGITMTGITAYELASGDSFSGRGGTTVGGALTRQGTSSSDSDSDSDSDSGSDSGRSSSGASEDTGETGGPGGGTPSASPSRAPGEQGDGTPSGGDGGTAGSPTPAPTAPGETGGESGAGGGETSAGTPSPPAPSATPPEPGASSRSGSAAPGPAGPAAP
ncbi:hypothetical protein ACFV83_29920 [Streptomyces pharetrae]|jgi:hypothetical protein|uniref:hypothetical protein n=1 Tax=Streptomyces pharetrae TaxID=291370 RepID=UPI00365F6CDC